MPSPEVTRTVNCEPTALVLSGGGARAAYQVGVLRALTELVPVAGCNPFSIITGTSAGAINAAALACNADDLGRAVANADHLWRKLTVDQVYRAGYLDLASSVISLLASLFNRGTGMHKPLALLNTEPLRHFLDANFDFPAISKHIANGDLRAVGVTASAYGSGESVTFYQDDGDIKPWQVARRRGCHDTLSADHLLASSAIPTILPATRVGDRYYGDGALRQMAPISPALHLGAKRVMVIGVSGNSELPADQSPELHSPSLAEMVGHVFNSAFIDALDSDIQHLGRINDLLGIIQNEVAGAPNAGLNQVDLLCINPSFEIDRVAGKHVHNLPRSMRTVLNITGATEDGGGSSMASYLLFDGNFCGELMDCGYQDAMAQADMIQAFFAPATTVPLD